MNLQILVGSAQTRYNRDYGGRWSNSQKTSKEQTRRHKSGPQEAPPTPSPSSPPWHSVLSLLCTFPRLQPGSLLAWPACQPGCLTHWRPPPALSLSPSTQKGSNFLLHFLPQLQGLVDSKSVSPVDRESFSPVHSFCFHLWKSQGQRDRGHCVTLAPAVREEFGQELRDQG